MQEYGADSSILVEVSRFGVAIKVRVPRNRGSMGSRAAEAIIG